MTFKEFWDQLTDEQKEAYAAQAGTTANYIRQHLVPARRVPRREFMARMVEATEGQVSQREMLDHFYAEYAA